MTPIAQLIAELRDDAESIACGMTLDDPADRARVQAAMLSAAEALARQEELLAEAVEVVDLVAEAAANLGDLGDGHFILFTPRGYVHDRFAASVADFRAAARLSEKLKGE
jgi:hypothetical protein